MKAAFLLLTIALASAGCRVGFAQTVSNTQAHQESRLAARQGKSASSGKKARPSIPLPKAAEHRRTLDAQRGSTAQSTANTPQEVLKPRNSAVASGPNQRGCTTHKARSAQPRGNAGAIRSTPGGLGHQSASLVRLGGPRNTSIAGTAALNGNGIKHRP